MKQSARLQLGPAESDGTRVGVVTDQGGLRVLCRIAADAAVPALRSAAESALTYDDIALLGGYGGQGTIGAQYPAVEVPRARQRP
jgi:hypothetical protein